MANTPPSVVDFRARYPEFEGVQDSRVQYWMTDALRIVMPDWLDSDFEVAILAYAAHQLALQGEGAGSGAGVGLPGGLTSFRSASMSVGVSEKVASALASGQWSATRYGADFELYLRRNRGGPVVVSSGACGCEGGAPWLR